MSELKHRLLSMSRKVEAVHPPGLETGIHLRRMSGHERDQYQEAMFAADKEQKEKGTAAALLPLQPLLLSLCICDEHGNRVFEDPREVSEMDGMVLDFLAEKAMELNGFTKESREEIEKKA